MKKVLIVDFWRSPHIFNFVAEFDDEIEVYFLNPIAFKPKWWFYRLITHKKKGDIYEKLNKRVIYSPKVNIISKKKIPWIISEYFTRNFGAYLPKFTTILKKSLTNSFYYDLSKVLKDIDFDLIFFSANPNFIKSIDMIEVPILVDVAGATDSHILNQIKLVVNKYPELFDVLIQYESSLKMSAQKFNSKHHFLVPSEYVRKSLIEEDINPENISLIRYPLHSVIDFELRLGQNKPLKALYSGRISYLKGSSILMRTVHQMSEDRITFSLFGNIQDDIKLSNKIKHVKYLDNKDYLKKLKDFDIYIHPSITEGMSYSVLEAMSAGLVVVCSSNSGYTKIIKNNVNGFVYDFKSHESLNEILDYIIDNPQIISDISINAYNTAKEFTRDKYNRELMSVINAKLR
jgi:glycosyltransferase involved in cell wall biosynthesis